MGILSGSKKSSSKSKTKQNIASQNAGFSEISGTAIAANARDDVHVNAESVEGDQSSVIRGDGNTIQYMDGGAIEAALSFAETANNDAADSIQESIAAVTESARSETESIAHQIKTVGIYVVVGFFGWQIVKAWSKST